MILGATAPVAGVDDRASAIIEGPGGAAAMTDPRTPPPPRTARELDDPYERDDATAEKLIAMLNALPPMHPTTPKHPEDA
jgi:hypothetical protein